MDLYAFCWEREFGLIARGGGRKLRPVYRKGEREMDTKEMQAIRERLALAKNPFFFNLPFEW